MKDVGETKAMQQTEAENHHRPPDVYAVGHDVLHRDIDDGRGDQRLHDRRRKLDDAGHAESQRRGVGKGERGDLPQQRAQPRRQQKQADDEQNVIEALWDDMGKADLEIANENRAPALVFRFMHRQRGGGVAGKDEFGAEHVARRGRGHADDAVAEPGIDPPGQGLAVGWRRRSQRQP